MKNHEANAATNTGPRTALAAQFKYLDSLRESGVTNMFGAGPYVERRFKLSRDKASEVVIAWMRTFSRDRTPEERAASVAAVGDREGDATGSAGA